MVSPFIQPFLDQRCRPVFIDKTGIIAFLNQMIDEKNRFHCVTMPSRFGKTYIAQALVAYYTNSGDSKEAFADLLIGRHPSFASHLNQHDVIWLDIAGICAGHRKEEACPRIVEVILERLAALYPNEALPHNDIAKAVAYLHEEHNATFIFIIDEWDYLLRNYRDDPSLFDNYIGLLRSLFKNSLISSAIDLCYMTGIMPIKRYGSMSALNDFREYTMLSPGVLAPYYGFNDAEAKQVIAASHTTLTLQELKHWYDGYYFPSVGEVYCPNSLICACRDNECNLYFADTMADEAITASLSNHKISLVAESALLLEGGSVRIDPLEFSGDLADLDTPSKGLVALVHSGFLLFDKATSSVKIPNKEVKEKFARAVKSLRWGALIDDSTLHGGFLLDSILAKDNAKVAAYLDKYHYPLAGPYHHASEDNFSVCMRAMLWDNGRYDMLSETFTGYGRADLVYIPHPQYALTDPTLIIELKVDKDEEEAFRQIDNRSYFASLQGHQQNMLLIGINYDSKSKTHQVKIQGAVRKPK